jgi:hypothetical protein
MCPVSRKDIAQPKARLMPLELAGACAARLAYEFGVRHATFGNWGEPLVHPEFTRIVDVFARVGFRSLFLSSSLSVTIDADALIASSLTQIDCSISGLTPDVYNIGHRAGYWPLVEANIVELGAAWRRRGKGPKLGLRWHRYKHNEHQLEAASAFAARHGFAFKPYYGHLGGIDAHLALDRGTLAEGKRQFIEQSVFMDFIERSVAKHVGGTSCPQAQNLIVHSDGRLLHCCALMQSHEFGVDFLKLPRAELERFKQRPNLVCDECLAKGWAGFMHAPKTDDALIDADEAA